MNIEQATGFEPMTSRLTGNHRRTARDRTRDPTTELLVLYRAELHLLASEWQDSHLRPHGPEPCVLLLNYTQRIEPCRRAESHPAAIKPYGSWHAASESNAAGLGLEPGPVPDGDVYADKR